MRITAWVTPESTPLRPKSRVLTEMRRGWARSLVGFDAGKKLAAADYDGKDLYRKSGRLVDWLQLGYEARAAQHKTGAFQLTLSSRGYIQSLSPFGLIYMSARLWMLTVYVTLKFSRCL